MDSKLKDAGKTKDVLRQIQADLRQLQTTVTAMQHTDASGKGAGNALIRKDPAEKGEWTVQYAVRHEPPGGAAPLNTGILRFTEGTLAQTTDEAAAALGYAISSPQKVALLRALLLTETESAAALGEAAHLSTGSLYHHLHDLMHSGLIGQAGRNRYVLTERGRRVLLVLLALAA